MTDGERSSDHGDDNDSAITSRQNGTVGEVKVRIAVAAMRK